MPGPDISPPPSKAASTSLPPSKDDAPSTSSASPKKSLDTDKAGVSEVGAPEAKVGAAGVETPEVEQDEEEADIGSPSTDEVVDMEVFGQLLEIVRRTLYALSPSRSKPADESYTFVSFPFDRSSLNFRQHRIRYRLPRLAFAWPNKTLSTRCARSGR